MSCSFCADCDRLRITAEGILYPCLMDRPSGSILPALRPVFDPERLDALLLEGLRQKAPEHPPEGFGVMTSIGG
jgi:GTP 3',8-cyclase